MEFNNLGVSGGQFPNCKKYFTEGRVVLFTVLTNLIGILGTSAFIYVIQLISKLVVTFLIVKHPEMSDEKVKSITRMFSKNIRI